MLVFLFPLPDADLKAAGTLLALIVTAFLTRKIKDVRFIAIYPIICLITLIAVLLGQNQTFMIAGAFIIGWAGAGGLLGLFVNIRYSKMLALADTEA